MGTSPLLRRAPRRPRRFVGLATIGLIVVAQAQAEPLRRCHVDGQLVVQAAPCAGDLHPASTALRPTPVAAGPADDVTAPPKKRRLADIMREREAENRARTKARPPQPDGSRILRDRMGAL
jgi:hypothetical protein